MGKIENILKTKQNIPLPKKAIVSLLYTYGYVNNKLNNVLKPFEISIQQFNVLRILRGQNNKPVTLETIQERMINKMSNTTRLINKLIKKNYVEKRINKENRRKIDITITADGLKILTEVDKFIYDTEKSLVQTLSENESLELIRLLGKIRLIAN